MFREPAQIPQHLIIVLAECGRRAQQPPTLAGKGRERRTRIPARAGAWMVEQLEKLTMIKLGVFGDQGRRHDWRGGAARADKAFHRIVQLLATEPVPPPA